MRTITDHNYYNNIVIIVVSWIIVTSIGGYIVNEILSSTIIDIAFIWYLTISTISAIVISLQSVTLSYNEFGLHNVSMHKHSLQNRDIIYIQHVNRFGLHVGINVYASTGEVLRIKSTKKIDVFMTGFINYLNDFPFNFHDDVVFGVAAIARAG